jgi:biotin carboxylase
LIRSAAADEDPAVRLLLIAPSTSYRLGAFLDAAGELGCAVTVASDTPSAIAGATISVGFDDPLVAAEALLAQVRPIDAVVGTDGDAVAVAAEVARLLGLPANPPDAMATAGDKHLQRLAAEANGVPQPGFAIVGDEIEWSMFPAVVKPLRRSASQGVIRVDTAAELAVGVRRVRQITGSGEPVLVERFVPGMEVAVEGMLRGGDLDVLAVFDKPDTPEGPHFPETLLISPARLEPDGLAAVVDVADRACAAVGLLEGPVHVECKINRSGVWFVELAARTIGGLCSRALRHDGASLEALVIHHALRLPPQTLLPQGSNGVLMLPVPATGRMNAVRGAEEARAVEAVTDVIISVGSGEYVRALPDGDRYLGFVFARAGTADIVEDALRHAWACLEVDITAS